MTKTATAGACTQQTAPEAGHGPTGRPLSYFQRRLHCRVDLGATHRLSTVCEVVPARTAADDRATTDSEDVIVVGCAWTSDAKRAVVKFQPKLEPGVQQPIDVHGRSHLATSQVTTVVNQPRHGLPTARRREVDASGVGPAQPTKPVTVASSKDDQSTDVRNVARLPQTQPLPAMPEVPQSSVPVVRRGRGRPRKYPPKPTVSKQQTKSTLPEITVPRPRNDAMRNRLICDKENMSPRSSAVAAAKRNADELDRNVWTSNFVRDAAYAAKSLQTSGLTANKLAGFHQRQKLAELPVNVILSDDNNNFQKKPTENMTPNFRLKELDKDKLLSAWNAFKGTLQSDDWSAISRKDEIGDRVKCQTTEPHTAASTEVAGEKRQEKIENRTTEHQKKPSDVLQTPMLEPGPLSNKDVPCQQTTAKSVHWKHPEIDDVRQTEKKVATVEFLDEPLAADLPNTPFPFADDFDDERLLLESLGKPLFTSTPIKLTDAARSACSAAVPGKRARVRFRPVTQVGNDEDDVGDRVELSKLAALPSMQHGATQISGVRPADIVRAFRTIDNVAAAATSTLPLSSHGVPPTLPFAAVPATVRTLPDHSPVENQVNAVADTLSPAATTTTSEDASPLPGEVVPEKLLHFYGSHYDGPPYNLSPSTGGFVTKAARKRPIVDDGDAPADRKRFQSDAPAVAAAGDVLAPSSVWQSVTAAEPPLLATSRPDVDSQCRPEAEMTSRDAVRGVRRAANGVPVDELLRLQRKLSTISDAATLRRVVQIIGETGKYCVNDLTFDFDLCNLHSATVTRLIQCLDAAASL